VSGDEAPRVSDEPPLSTQHSGAGVLPARERGPRAGVSLVGSDGVRQKRLNVRRAGREAVGKHERCEEISPDVVSTAALRSSRCCPRPSVGLEETVPRSQSGFVRLRSVWKILRAKWKGEVLLDS